MKFRVLFEKNNWLFLYWKIWETAKPLQLGNISLFQRYDVEKIFSNEKIFPKITKGVQHLINYHVKPILSVFLFLEGWGKPVQYTSSFLIKCEHRWIRDLKNFPQFEKFLSSKLKRKSSLINFSMYFRKWTWKSKTYSQYENCHYHVNKFWIGSKQKKNFSG